MYHAINNIYSFYENKNGKELSCPFIEGFCKIMLTRVSLGTLKTYIPMIHKFWLYSIHNPPKEESFSNYMWEYRKTIAQTGFKITKSDVVLAVPIKYTYENFSHTNSVRTDMTALKMYFDFIFDELNNENFKLVNEIPYGAYGDALNYNKLSHSNKHSGKSSYGLKSRGMMRDALAVNRSIFDELIKSKKFIDGSNEKRKDANLTFDEEKEGIVLMSAFPYFHFENFIQSVRNPRNRLLYLLCGLLGARKSQALCLTIYDIDIENKKVYLTDPLSEDKPVNEHGEILMNQEGRKTLLKKYKINAELSPHSLIRFKYPIPIKTEASRELLFLPNTEEVFFDTYFEVLETIDTRTNPFIFQTKTGKRYLPSEASTLFKGDYKRFQTKTGYAQNIVLDSELHCFRHMYATVWAEIAYSLEALLMNNKGSEKQIPRLVEMVKILVAKKMGIKSDAINVYFNRNIHTEKQTKKIMEKFGKSLMDIHKAIISMHNQTTWTQ